MSNQKLQVSTPEECLFMTESEIDTCANHETIMDALWALHGNLLEAQKILEVSHSMKGF
jgi:hypothetical protein